MGTGGGGVEGRGGGVVGKGGGTPGAGMLGTAGTLYCGACMDKFWKLESVSSEGVAFNGLGGLLTELGRAGLTGSAATGTGACGAEINAAELGAGACFALLFGEVGPTAVFVLDVGAPVVVAPIGDFPLKQLSQTF